ncbi:MAG: metallophosphoesterase, partial [Candidatus Hydrogenedentes bacterium]|nr:metallophosphoesterase [Candidatus Hydrogenedentota bacterium]
AQWGKLLEETDGRFPDAAFCTISGDLVGTGMEREDWDDFLTFGEPMFRTRPVMPAIGNHDAQLGLPPSMYLQVFGLPEAGPAGLTPERAYTFRYSNTQFFVLDVMSDAGPQREWLRQELEKSEARWKIAVFHFPLYSREEAYPRLVEAWGTLFDQYHVDLVLTGHIHSHLRTRPMRAGQPVASPAEGTVYLTSVSIPTRPLRREKPDFAEVWLGGGLFCNVIDVSEDQLHVRAVTTGGEVKDEFTIKK